MPAQPAVRLSFVLKISILVIWVVLFSALLKRDFMVESLDIKENMALARSSQESFLGIFFQDERIGYVQNKFTPSDSGDVLLEQKAHLLLNILNERKPVTLSGSALLNAAYLLKEFSFRMEAPFYQMDVKGEVIGTTINLTLNTGKQEISEQIQLQNPPFLSTNRRGYLLSPKLEEGSKVRIPYFDPFTLSVQKSLVEYKGQEKILIKGRVYNLHRFVESYAGIRVNSWLNDMGDVVKEESPAGFVFIAEPEFLAKDISGSTKEVLNALSVPLLGKLPNLANRKEMSYKLTLPEGSEFELSKDRQLLKGDILSIYLEDLPTDAALVCDEQDDDLAATPYLQVNHKDITKLVADLDMDELSPRQKIEKLSTWLYENIDKKPVIGIPDAVTTLTNKRGDCNEHAALFTALARNAGIPSRIAAGVTLHKEAFYYHAWNEACIGGNWLSIDTTLNQIPADLGHIKFVEGETKEQVKIGALLGKLKIEVVE